MLHAVEEVSDFISTVVLLLSILSTFESGLYCLSIADFPTVTNSPGRLLDVCADNAAQTVVMRIFCYFHQIGYFAFQQR